MGALEPEPRWKAGPGCLTAGFALVQALTRQVWRVGTVRPTDSLRGRRSGESRLQEPRALGTTQGTRLYPGTQDKGMDKPR